MPMPLSFGRDPWVRLRDRNDRVYSYLRFSLTDRCDLACVYCMPPGGEEDHSVRREMLDRDEVVRLVRVLARGGIRRVRLTGGEPLVRKDIVDIVGRVRRDAGIDEIVMTTNGTRLAELAKPLRDAGLAGVNVSIDSFDVDTFRRVTRGGDLDQVLRGVEAALALPFSVSVDAAGRALSLRFAKETDVLARGLLRGLVAASQLVVPPGASGEWLTSEQDAVGEVFAAYRQTGAREITRSRVRYERIASSGGLVPVTQVGNVTGTSVTRFVFEGDAAPIRIASDATTRTEPEPGVRGLPPSEGRVRTTWTRVAEGTEAPSREPRADDVVLALAAVDGGGRRSDAERAEGATFPELARSLATLPPGGARAAEAAKLRALLRADDGAVDQAKRAVLAPGTKDGKKQLVSALGAAGTRRAQAALVELSETRALGEDLRTDALMQLGTTREPTLDAVASLEKLSSDPDAAIRHTAELALGNQARSMQAAGRAGEADEVVKHLLDQYAAASSDDERATALRALGNTGSPALLPLARAAAMSGSAALRTAAAVALRFVEDPGAVTLLAHLMTADGDPDVRGGAIFAAGHRDVAPLLPALARVLAYDEHGRNRRAVVDVLAEKRALEPALAMLRSVAETDPDPELREAARRLLTVRAG